MRARNTEENTNGGRGIKKNSAREKEHFTARRTLLLRNRRIIMITIIIRVHTVVTAGGCVVCARTKATDPLKRDFSDETISLYG